jgi:hypothetical protein
MRFNLPQLALLTGLASVLAVGSASGATLAPTRTTSDMRGVLKFYPDDGGQPFKCKVRFTLRTRDGVGGTGKKEPAITAAVGLNSCPRLFFFELLPWDVGAGPDGVTATVASLSWAEQGGSSCSQPQPFTVDANGIWTATSGCVTGSLTTDPPITIAK